MAAAIDVFRAGDALAHPTTDDDRRRRERVDLPQVARVLAHAHAGRDGRFEVGALAAGSYLVQAVTDDGARGGASIEWQHPGERSRVDVEVRVATYAIRGTVKRSGGTPYRGEVFVVPAPLLPRGGAVGTSLLRFRMDESGGVDATGLPAGSCLVVVSDGSVRSQCSVDVPQRNPFEIVLPDDEQAVRGLVVDRATGVGVAGAEVVCDGVYAADPATRATTDAEGRFAVPLVKDMSLTVRASGYAPLREWTVRDADALSRIALDRPATVRGRATRAADGAPVAGLVVEADADGWGRSDIPQARTVTDAEGRYEVPGLPPGEISIRARGAAGVARGMADLSLEDGAFHPSKEYDPLAVEVAAGQTAALDLVIEPAARVEGRVADAAGHPEIGLVVRAACPTASGMPSSWPPPPAFWETEEVVTGTDGRYVLDGLVPHRRYDVSVVRGALRASSEITSPASGGTQVVPLAFPPTFEFDLQVVDEGTGVGIEGIQVKSDYEAGWLETWSGVTGEGGHLRVGPLRRADKTVLLVPDPDTVWDSERRVEIDSSALSTAAPWVLRTRRPPPMGPAMAARAAAWRPPARATPHEPPDRPLRVRVLDSAGQPVPVARLAWKRGDRSGSVDVAQGLASVPRPADSLIPTSVVAEAARAANGTSLPLGARAAGPFAPDLDEAEVRMPPEQAIVGRVIDADGRGVRGVRVRASRRDEEDRWGHSWPVVGLPQARTDGDGRFRIGGLADETIDLAVGAPTAYSDMDLIEVRLPSESLEIRLRPAVTAAITLTDPGGRSAAEGWVSVARVRPSAQEIGRHGPDDRPIDARTGPDGVAHLVGLDPEATYQLTASIPVQDEERPWRKAYVHDWSPHDTEVHVVDLLKIRGVVRDLAGRPVAHACVVRLADNEYVDDRWSADDGTFSLDYEPDPRDRTLSLFASMMEHGQGAKSDTSPAPAGDGLVVLILNPGLDLAVRLEGASIAKRTVGITDDPGADANMGGWIWTYADDEGRALIRGLRPDHSYTVWVRPESGQGLSAGSADTYAFVDGCRAGASAPESRIRLVEGGTLRGHMKGVSRGGYATVEATRGGMEVRGTISEEGSFVIRGLPNLEWSVVAKVGTDAAQRVGRATGRPGDDLVIEVAAPAPK